LSGKNTVETIVRWGSQLHFHFTQFEFYFA